MVNVLADKHLGMIPAVIALAFRFTIPESPRYKLDILRNVHTVFEDTKDYFGSPELTAEGGELETLPTSPTIDGHALSRASTSSEIAPDEVVGSDSESERRPSSVHRRPASYQHVQLPPGDPDYSKFCSCQKHLICLLTRGQFPHLPLGQMRKTSSLCKVIGNIC